MKSYLIAGLALAWTCGCDEKLEVRNEAPTATASAYCEVDGRAFIVVDIVDIQAEPVDLLVVVSGERLAPATGGDGLFGLVSMRSGPGEQHWVGWSDSPDACDYAFPEIGSASGCQIAPSVLPPQLSGDLLASDRTAETTTPFSLQLGEGCESRL